MKQKKDNRAEYSGRQGVKRLPGRDRRRESGQTSARSEEKPVKKPGQPGRHVSGKRPEQPGKRVRRFRQQSRPLQAADKRAQALPTPPQGLADLPGLPPGRPSLRNIENAYARIQQPAGFAVLIQPHQRGSYGCNAQINAKRITILPRHNQSPNIRR